MQFILENLAVGAYHEALRPSREINAFLCVAQERDLPATVGLYHKIPVVDMQPIPSAQLKEAVEWIRDHISDHTILVFCHAGIGRSPSVVVGYLCCVVNYGFGAAVEHVARRKPDMSILPNLLLTIEEVRRLMGRTADQH